MKKFLSTGRKSIYMFLALMCSVLVFGSMFSVQAAGSTVYVDGNSGVDTSSGLTTDAPVQSLEKAYELAGAGGTIYVVDTVSVSGAVELSSVTIARYSSNLNHMIEIADGGTLTLTNVTVDGKDIDADYSAFKVLEGGTLSVIGGALQNNRSLYRVGGAIYNKGNINLTNVLVTNNYSNYDGGAIYSFDTGSVISSDSTFSNNAVQHGSSGVYYDGAAVYNRGEYISNNDTFEQNDADFGGAVYNEGTLTITDSSFTSNTAARVGGAVVNDETGTATMTGAKFTENSGLSCGGVQNLGELTIVDCEFTLNVTTGDGGALYNGNGSTAPGNLYIRGNTLISQNTANNGGGIFNFGGTINFESGTITKNKATHDAYICFGGGVLNYGRSSRIAVFNMTGGIISDNYALDNGGGVYNNFDSEMNLSGGTITGNTTPGDGGGIYLYERATLNLTGGTVSNNSAKRGAGIYIINAANISGGTVSGNTCESSTNTTNGGGIYIAADAQLTLTGGSILDNSADYGNGIYQKGIFNISANGKVNTNNDVYLNTSCFVTVNGALSYTDTGAVITPSGYTLGRECVRADYGSAVASDIYSQFDLTPKNNYLFRPGDYIDDSAGIADTAVVISASYAVTYDANGGTGAPEAQTKYWNEPITLSSVKPTKTGCAFKSWNTSSSGSGTTYASGATYSANEALSLYAQWEANSYTNRIFHWAGGFVNSEGNNAAKTMFQLGETSFTAAYKSTYILDTDRATSIPNGFSLSSAFGTSAISGTWANYSMGTSITQKDSYMNYQYNYFPNNYSITYNLNGGANNSSNPTSYNVLYGVTLAEPTKTGYNFTGWKDAEGNIITGINEGKNATFTNAEDLYNQLASRTTGNITLTAQWTPVVYTNTIDHWMFGFTDGEGTNATNTAIKIGSTTFMASYGSSYVMDGSKATTIPNGFELRNAFRTNAVTGTNADYVLGTSITQPARVASFEYRYDPITYNITYDYAGGTAGVNAPTSYNVLYGVTLVEPTKTGYNFTGWKDAEGNIISGINEGANGTFSSTEDMYNKLATRTTGDLTLTAQWLPITYKVKYDGNDADGGTMSNSTHTYDVLSPLSANQFTRTEHSFDGWNTAADGSGTSYVDQESVKNLSSIDGDIVVLYAQWENNVVDVTLNPNGGTVSPESIQAIIDEPYGTLPTPTRPGYDFDGWYTSPTGGSEVTKDTVVTETEDHTIYAHWEPITYTIEFDGNGADGGDMPDSTHTYDQSKALPPNEFSRTDYIFKGWNTQPDGSGTSYADKALIRNLTTVDGDVITLYAQWSFKPAPPHFRFIKENYFETLLPNSKWRSAPLKSNLSDVLDDDLADTSSCQQVWHFTAEEFEAAREWCMNQEKGTDTNQEFLNKYKDSNREQ